MEKLFYKESDSKHGPNSGDKDANLSTILNKIS